MLLIHLAQDMNTWVTGVTSLMNHAPVLGDSGHGLLWDSSFDWNILAKTFNTDVFAGTRAWFNNFVKSGQIWALLIGMVLGYLIRGMTTYS